MIEARKNILVVGNGGRDHAIGWKLSQDAKAGGPQVRLYFAEGNRGTANLGQNLDNVGVMEIDRQVQFARDKGIDFVIYGPEAPLAAGAVDAMNEAGVQAFGPTQEAAKVESSKAYGVRLMKDFGIPHPKSRVFLTYDDAVNYVDKKNASNLVIKADELAGGKGVFLPADEIEARSNLRSLMIEEALEGAGKIVVIQERLSGEEVSVMALVSDDAVVLLPTARDYKRRFDNDEGLNTGGMGAFSPNDQATDEDLSEIYHGMLLPFQKGMKDRKTPFKGVIFAGVMLTSDGPKLLEFNVRFGDPETQVQLPRINSPLLYALEDTISGTLTPEMVRIDRNPTVGVVLASREYPEPTSIESDVYVCPNLPKDILVFYGGNKGRVLTVVGRGKNARENVYKVLENGDVSASNTEFRTDIAS